MHCVCTACVFFPKELKNLEICTQICVRSSQILKFNKVSNFPSDNSYKDKKQKYILSNGLSPFFDIFIYLPLPQFLAVKKWIIVFTWRSHLHFWMKTLYHLKISIEEYNCFININEILHSNKFLSCYYAQIWFIWK